MHKVLLIAIFLTTLSSIGMTTDRSRCQGEVDVHDSDRIILGSETYLIPSDNVAEGGSLLSGLFEAQPDSGDELLLKFDGQAFQAAFGIDLGSEKLFVIESGERAERSREDRIRRSQDVLSGGPQFCNRTIEPVPEIGGYRVFRNGSIKMFWDLALVDPSDADLEKGNPNSVVASCSSEEGGNICSFVFYLDGFVVRHNMPERYAPLNSKISEFVIQRLKGWKV